MEDHSSREHQDDIFSRVVRAGKRTYFFDVKSTRSNELYLTITESKKRFNQQTGHFFYEKHKLFLYREDFDKFMEALTASFGAIGSLQGEILPRKPDPSDEPDESPGEPGEEGPETVTGGEDQQDPD